mmetsp:Transcript_6881/g.13087  ORF Transcript_6881/g.13087 Transcript_6881/m.13087 type:complete len:231 (+) Transcript_6881:1074-1766(+)
MRASSSFSASMIIFLRSIWDELARATSCSSLCPATRFSYATCSSSSFMRSSSANICLRSWSRSSSCRRRSCARSSICFLRMAAPRRRSSPRRVSLSSYASSALMRSISIMRSSLRASSSSSSMMCFFSSICASRMVTHLLYNIIWFMCFTSSSSSSSMYCARDKLPWSASFLSCSVSEGGTRFLRSSSMRSIFSLRAIATARDLSRSALASCFILRMSSSFKITARSRMR